MDTSKLCMYCMEDNGGSDVCPHCGKDANAPLIGNHLKPGEVIGGRFVVGRAVGQDATGVVYMVFDTIKGNKMRIREYLPRGIAARGEDGVTLNAMPGMAEQFDEGMSEMLARAESAEDPSRAMAHFEENGTLYVVLRKKKAAAAAAVALPDDEDEPEMDGDEEEFDDEEEEDGSLVGKLRKHMTTMLVCLFIVLLLIASIFIMVSRSSTDQTNNPGGLNSSSPLDGWSAPTETPLPTAAATDEFGNIIKPEQGWQNEAGGENLDDWGEPEKTEIPEDYEPDWLTQATNVPMNTSTPEPSVEPTVEATEEPLPTLEPEKQIFAGEEIDENSNEETIRLLQARLIELGWLDIEKPTGNFRSMTVEAIESFQKCVNAYMGEQLPENGRATVETINWLNRIDAPRNPEIYPTAEPTAEPTAVPTDAPEITDQPEVTGEPQPTLDPARQLPEDEEIDEDSDKDDIRLLQARLIELGWLDIEKPTGTFASMTEQALEDFQEYVNETMDGGLTENGRATVDTIKWLNRVDAPRNPEVYPTELPTMAPTATPEPTAAPEPTDEPEATDEPLTEPDAALTAEVQARLIELGWLDASQGTGVFDNATMLALKDYQVYLNQVNPNAMLPETGYPDENTLLWLRWSGAPTRPDVMPETTPTVEPTATPEPVVVPFEVNEESSEEDILWLQNKLNELQWTNIPEPSGVYDGYTRRAVTNLQDYLNRRYSLSIETTGLCDNVTTSYLASEYNLPVNPNPETAIIDDDSEVTQDPNEAPDAEGNETPEPDNTAIPAPVETEVPATEAPATDVPPTDAPATPEPTQEPAIGTAKVLGKTVVNVRSEADADSDKVTQVETGSMVEVLAEVEADDVIWYRIRTGEHVGYIRGDLLELQVEATDVPATDVPATDAPATDVPATDVPATDVPATDVPATDAPATDIPATDMPATDAPTATPEPAVIDIAWTVAEVVNVRSEPNADSEKVTQFKGVGAEVEVLEKLDVDGVVWYRIRYNEIVGYVRGDLLALKSEATEAPTDAPATEAPATEVPATEVPATEVPATDVPATEVPATEVPATDVPATEVPATEVPATEVPATEVPATEVPATEVPATEVPATEVPATEVPATETPEPTPTYTPEPTEDPSTFVDETSEEKRIKMLQDKLVELGWLLAESGYEEGVYDAATGRAVMDLQLHLISLYENGTWAETLPTPAEDYLPEVDDGSRADVNTLNLLFNWKDDLTGTALVKPAV